MEKKSFERNEWLEVKPDKLKSRINTIVAGRVVKDSDIH